MWDDAAHRLRYLRRRAATPPATTVVSVAIGPMVPLTTVASPMAARILAAHLGAEGIVWQLRGDVDGPYPIGPVEVLVPADELELARAVIGVDDAADNA